MKVFLYIILILAASPAFAAKNLFTKEGKILRLETGDYEHCIFLPKGEKEEIDLWPNVKPLVHCENYIGKKVKVTFRHEKIKIPENYGTMDVLRLIKIVPITIE